MFYKFPIIFNSGICIINKEVTKMLVRDYNITIDVDRNTFEMMKYCNSHTCEGIHCPYNNMCNEFVFKHGTLPYLFWRVDGKPLTSL